MICYLVRHGKDDETVRGGWSSSGLTDEGNLQVKKLVNYIAENKNKLNIERLFSSDLPRAVQTITPISILLNIKVVFLKEFRETNNGVLAGMPNDTANKKYPGLYWSALEWNQSYPKGESPCSFYERVKTAWEQFSKKIIKDNKNVILVTHNGVINVIYSIINETTFSNKKKEYIPHAEMIPLKYYENVWKINSRKE